MSTILTQGAESKDATLIFFNEYTVHYYSQSSNPWEAAYINCFQNDGMGDVRHTGYLIFTYPQHTTLPGQEPVQVKPTDIPATQVNKLEKVNGKDFFFLYYTLNRFNDVINLLKYCKNQPGSMLVSADPLNHVWALCNNLHVPNGAQYEV